MASRIFEKFSVFLLLAFSLSFSCDGRSSCEGGCAIFLNILDLKNNPKMAELFASIDDSLYARKMNHKYQDPEPDGLAGLCGCDPGGIFLESRHVDLMDSGWHFNSCGNPDSIVKLQTYSSSIPEENYIVESNSVLSRNIETLKRFLKDDGCIVDSVYEISAAELTPENAKKGIYATSINVLNRDVVVPKNVRVLKTYHPNGKLAQKIQFEQGKRNGTEMRYFPHGKKYKVTNFKDGLRHGIEIEYDESGYKKYEEPYRNGKLHGIKKYYDEKGRIWSKQKYVDDVEISSERVN